jgi:hypothetical protein
MGEFVLNPYTLIFRKSVTLVWLEIDSALMRLGFGIVSSPPLRCVYSRSTDTAHSRGIGVLGASARQSRSAFPCALSLSGGDVSNTND